MDKKWLIRLIQAVVLLKEKLKCPICLDVIQDVVELDCGHRFCADCYSECRSTKKHASCPLCKTVQKRRSPLYKDSYASSLGKFVHKMNNDIHKHYNCEVERLLQELNEEQTPVNVLKDDTIQGKYDNLPSTSKACKNTAKKPDLSKENCGNAFDKLMNATEEPFSFNKKGSKQVYTNKKKQEVQASVEQSILQTVNDEDRAGILKWLRDIRNTFGRLTQTQVGDEKENTPLTVSTVTDMDSISQVKENCKPVVCNNQKRRAKSLDVEIKKVAPKEKERRSLGERLGNMENYEIEEIDTEEEKVVKEVEKKVLLNLIEDEYLDELESQMKDLNGKSEPDKVKKVAQSSGTGWERKGKIEKSIKKREKEQLSVTLQTTQGNKSESGGKKMSNVKSKINDLTVGHVSKRDLKVILLRHNMRYLVDKNGIENKRRLEIVLQKTDKCGKEVARLEMDKEKENTPEFKKPSKIGSNKNKKTNNKSCDLNKIEHHIFDTKSAEKNTTPSVSRKNSNELDKPVENRTVDNGPNPENISNDTNNKEIDDYVLINSLDNILIETVGEPPVHHTSTKSDPKHDVVMIHDDSDLEQIYDIPKQEIYNDVTIDLTKTPVETLNLLERILNRCLTNSDATKIDFIENQLQIMRCHVSNLKSFMEASKIIKEPTCDAATQTAVETIDVNVQTEVRCNTVALQTEILVEAVAAQTEDQMECAKCRDREIILSRSGDVNKNVVVLVADEQEQVGAPLQSQTEIFTSTFDNLNFDTQEISKNEGVIRMSTQKLTAAPSGKISTQAVASKEKSQRLPASVLVCSLNSLQKSKQSNRKSTFEPDRSRFKRIRAPTSDSDSDGELEPKKACNRFMRDDLTVEFQTNPVAACGESENIDCYDEYLAQATKNHENNNVTPTPITNKPLLKPTEKIVLKEIVEKCEEMMDQARQNLHHVKEIADISTSSKDSYKTAPLSNNFNEPLTDDNVFFDENNLAKLENDIQAYEKGVNRTHSPDVIVDTEEIQPLVKKARRGEDDDNNNAQSASLFARSDCASQRNVQVCGEWNDSLDAVLEDIDVGEETIEGGGKKITVIDNRVIVSPIRGKLGTKEVEDDLFSDEDIVETTPQKQISGFGERSILSQINNIPIPTSALQNPSCDIEQFDFDFSALPPPPDFQDDTQPSRPNNDNDPTLDDHQATLTNLNKSSLTPDKLSQYTEKNTKNHELSKTLTPHNRKRSTLSTTPDNLSLRDRKISHSTPVTGRVAQTDTLGLSPILADQSQLSNVIEVTQMPLVSRRPAKTQAQSYKASPLVWVSKNHTPKKNILTSIPKQKSIWNYVRPVEEGGPSIDRTKPCIACSRLREHSEFIHIMVESGMATFSSSFDRNVTHMIVDVDEENCLRDYTVKFVAAVAAGMWVLRLEWVQECLKQNRIVPEEPYEALDISGIPGPRTSRLTGKTNPLLRGYKFYCAEPFISTNKEAIKDVIRMLGGRILPSMEDLLENDGDTGLIMIGEGNATEDVELYDSWLREYNAATVDVEWLSRCVGRYTFLGIRPYVWCSDDNLTDVYPSHVLD